MISANGSVTPPKSPRRVEAGRRNRLKRGPLSSEGVARLRLAARLHRPWLRSTGPRTAAGKGRAAANGRRCQKGAYSIRQMRQMAGVGNLIAQMADLRRLAEGR